MGKELVCISLAMQSETFLAAVDSQLLSFKHTLGEGLVEPEVLNHLSAKPLQYWELNRDMSVAAPHCSYSKASQCLDPGLGQRCYITGQISGSFWRNFCLKTEIGTQIDFKIDIKAANCLQPWQAVACFLPLPFFAA